MVKRKTSKAKISKAKTSKRKSSSRKSSGKKSSKRASSSSKRVSKTSRASSQKNRVFGWRFPAKDLHILRIEMLMLVTLSVLVFLYMFFQPRSDFFTSVFLTILFLAIYFVVSAIIKKFREVEEEYEINKSHLEIKRYVNKKRVSTKKVPLKDIAEHRFDHKYHGAYVLTKKGKRHPLFFSSSAESRKAERKLKSR